MNVMIWILAGAVLGLLTYAATPQARPTMAAGTIALALAGAFFAGLLFSVFAAGAPPLYHGVVASLGAAALLAAYALTLPRAVV